jgi:FkbM family methyltransferase
MKNTILNQARRIISTILNIVPALPKMIEQELQVAQGKGFGSFSTGKEVESWVRFIDAKSSKQITILDIGANVGDYSSAVLERIRNVKVFAFEPSAFTHKKLTERFKNSHDVECINLAIGGKEGKAILWSDKPGSGLASLSHRKLEHFGIDFTSNEEIIIRGLDSWCLERSVVPDVIKIDVEGHELDVLNSGLIATSNAAAIQFEFGGCNIDSRSFFQDFWYFFAEKKFDLYRITPSGPKRIKKYLEQDECFRTTNYLAINPAHPLTQRNFK